jgi:hypothetical protein
MYVRYYSANNIIDVEELQKWTVLPMLRVLVVLSKHIKKSNIDFVLCIILSIGIFSSKTDG